MKYFYFVTYAYCFKGNFMGVGSICEMESDIALDCADNIVTTQDNIRRITKHDDAIISGFQLLRTEIDETDIVKIPDPTSWEAAPIWAKYKTMDGNGEIRVWTHEPLRANKKWLSSAKIDNQYSETVGWLFSPENYDWTKMIEKRPTT